MLEEEIVQELTKQRLTLAVAESCTGGLIGHRLTNVPGSSACFVGGIVAYHNQVKEDVLGVPAQLLAQHGAVSREAVEAMAQGVRRLLRADIGLAVSGIAGPTGGTPEKPLGLTFIALAAPNLLYSRDYLWHGGREENKTSSAVAALQLLWEYVTGVRGAV